MPRITNHGPTVYLQQQLSLLRQEMANLRAEHDILVRRFNGMAFPAAPEPSETPTPEYETVLMPVQRQIVRTLSATPVSRGGVKKTPMPGGIISPESDWEELRR